MKKDEIQKNIKGYRFDEAAKNAYQFVWHSFCDWYLELSKTILFSDNQDAIKEVRNVSSFIFREILIILHPFIPFITEEIWLKNKLDKNSNDFLMYANWSNENSSNFFDWIYTSSDENSPVMINEGNRVRICDGNFNLNNKNKWFGFIDNTDFFPNPDSDDASHNGFSFITSTYGFFLENNDKKWLYTENSTNNPGWSNPSKMGVRILANTSINASYASDEAEMTFKIYTATDTGGLDWGGKIKVYANVVYDDNSESLLGHQFKFGSSCELDCSPANTSVNIQCSIRPQNSLGEYLFNDKRIVGVRLYYTHSDDEYEIFYDLGLCHFADGFIRATETYTLDDTTGNTNRYVWSDTAQNGVSVSLYDLTAGTNVITYNTRPQIDDYTENNLRTVTNDIKFAEQKSGKPFSDDDIPDNLRDQQEDKYGY